MLGIDHPSLFLNVKPFDLLDVGDLRAEERERGDVPGADLEPLPADRLGTHLDDDLFKECGLPATCDLRPHLPRLIKEMRAPF